MGSHREVWLGDTVLEREKPVGKVQFMLVAISIFQWPFHWGSWCFSSAGQMKRHITSQGYGRLYSRRKLKH